MADASSSPPGLAHHFEDLDQQREASSIGMWAFLASEVMFFGGLLGAYLVYRGRYPEAFFEGSARLDVGLGTFNTAVLIGSSLTMALAVRAAQLGRRQRIVGWLGATMVLAVVFLGVKVVEYSHKIHDGLVPGPDFVLRGTEWAQSEIFFGLYFASTGMHALHMIVGVALMLVTAVLAWRGRYSRDNHAFVEGLGLYWHFVDLVWIFLFPLYYLLGRHA